MPKNHDKSPKLKTYKELSQEKQPFTGFKTGEQLPLFEMPPATASPAISQGLPKLQQLLSEQGIEIGDSMSYTPPQLVLFASLRPKRSKQF